MQGFETDFIHDPMDSWLGAKADIKNSTPVVKARVTLDAYAHRPSASSS
jgi:hypothetical protein